MLTEPVSGRDVASIRSDTSVQVVQSATPLRPTTWRLLNDDLFAYRPDIEFRIFGHYGVVCDLSQARHLSNVRRSPPTASKRLEDSKRSRLFRVLKRSPSEYSRWTPSSSSPTSAQT